MNAYRVVWRKVVSSFVAFGAFLALVTWSFGGSLGVFVVVTVGGVVVTAGVEAAEIPLRARREFVRNVATKSLAAGAVAVGLAGYVALVGGTALLAALIVFASAPFAITLYVRCYRRRVPPTRVASNQLERPDRSDERQEQVPSHTTDLPAPGRRPASTDRARLLPPGPEPGGLDDAQLCLEWRRSFRVLERSVRADRLRVVELRQRYLDELERRHPAKFRRWLESGARAAGDPSRFLGEGSGGSRPRHS